jgi:hypothetical protein
MLSMLFQYQCVVSRVIQFKLCRIPLELVLIQNSYVFFVHLAGDEILF